MTRSRERWGLDALHMFWSCRTSVLSEYAVFEAFDLGHDPGLQRLGALQAFARAIEKFCVGLGSTRQRSVIGARDDAGFVGLAPFHFQVVHVGVEVEVETAHGFLRT